MGWGHYQALKDAATGNRIVAAVKGSGWGASPARRGWSIRITMLSTTRCSWNVRQILQVSGHRLLSLAGRAANRFTSADNQRVDNS